MKKNKFDINSKLAYYSKSVESIHKLVSILKQFCDANKNADSLYEVSEVVNVVEDKLNKLGYEIFCDIHRDDKPTSLKAVLKKIKEENIAGYNNIGA